jgi:hypothetical protein
MITPAAAIADPNLLGAAFNGPSWDRWRAILRAAFGEPLDDAELALFREVAERDPSPRRVRELWVIAGRRSGKDSIASAIATVAAIGDHRGHLRPGERATVMCLASDRSQAKIVYRYIAGYFEKIPLLQPLVERVTENGIELTNDVEIVVTTNSYRAVRGRSIACAIFDEVAYWRDLDSATPDIETYNAVLPALVTLPGAMLIGISSPYRRSGLLFERWHKHYGQPSDDVLVVRGPSTTFNPTLPQQVIDEALARDYEVAAAEWLAEWRSDLADFVSKEVITSVTVQGRFELPPLPGIAYAGFCDPSGGSADSMTLAIAHRSGDMAVLDALREVKPPFSPESVVREFATLLKSYGIKKIVGDRYGGLWPTERFAMHGISYEPSEMPKSNLYQAILPMLNSGKVELLDVARLTAQFCGLERRTTRGGRDSIDHKPGSHDDIANAAAGALLLAAAPKPRGAYMIRTNFMAR